MKGLSICEKCDKEFEWIRSEGQVIPRFCSMLCRGHTGFKPGGSFRTYNESEEEKFLRTKKNFEKYVIIKDGCWDWKGCIEKNGYARLSCRDIKVRHAHTASYLIHIGKVPEGFQVNHLCHNRKCSNPLHLYIGTQQDNMRDKILANRQAKGSKNGNSKLTEYDVKKIKQMLKNGEKIKNVSDIFNVSTTQIRNINDLSQWKHIEA